MLVGLIDSAHRRQFEDVLGPRGVGFEGVETSGGLRTCLAVRDLGCVGAIVGRAIYEGRFDLAEAVAALA